MTPRQLSYTAWGGGAVAGAALATRHRLAAGALGAILVGSISDVLIERHAHHQPMTAAVVSGVGLVGLALYLVGRKDR